MSMYTIHFYLNDVKEGIFINTKYNYYYFTNNKIFE